MSIQRKLLFYCTLFLFCPIFSQEQDIEVSSVDPIVIDDYDTTDTVYADTIYLVDTDNIDDVVYNMEQDIVDGYAEFQEKEINPSDYKLDDNLDYPKISTPMGELYVLPNYKDLTDDLKEQKPRYNNKSITLYLVTKDNRITQTEILMDPLTIENKQLSCLRFSESNDAVTSIKDGDEFVITAFAKNPSEILSNVLDNKLKELTQKKSNKFTNSDLKKLELYPIATAQGIVVFNGVYGIITCRKIADYKNDAGAPVFIIEFLNGYEFEY